MKQNECPSQKLNQYTIKTIGVIGGISWHSTAVYYTTINKLVEENLGGYNAAKLLLYSINYNDFRQLQEEDNWTAIELMFAAIALKLEHAGADCILIACNAAHLAADSLASKLSIPFIHIADATAKEIARHKIKKVGLIGTKFTMENRFFIQRLDSVGIETILPADSEREFIHGKILSELANGFFNPNTKKEYLNIIGNLNANGAEAVVLGCTEIGMLLSQADTDVKLFDTTVIHSQAVVNISLNKKD